MHLLLINVLHGCIWAVIELYSYRHVGSSGKPTSRDKTSLLKACCTLCAEQSALFWSAGDFTYNQISNITYMDISAVDKNRNIWPFSFVCDHDAQPKVHRVQTKMRDRDRRMNIVYINKWPIHRTIISLYEHMA